MIRKERHPRQHQEWFIERIGQRIRRVAGGKDLRNCAGGLIVHNKDMAEYLYELQDQYYRYADMPVEVKIIVT